MKETKSKEMEMRERYEEYVKGLRQKDGDFAEPMSYKVFCEQNKAQKAK